MAEQVRVTIDPGIYLNLFKVNFEDMPVDLMVAARTCIPILRDFREALTSRSIMADVYSVDDRVYGYGAQQARLTEFGFNSEQITIGSIPQLAARLILDGFANELKQAGYSLQWSKQGATVFQMSRPMLELPVGISLYRGFDIQSLYLNDPELDGLFFAVVIDAAFTYRNANGEALRPDAVKSQYGEDALNALLIKQGDLAPMNKINLEVSRQRLLQMILPFVEQRGTFTLPCGIPARLSREPIRVVLAGNEEDV